MRIPRGEALLLRVLTLALGAVLMTPRPALACSMLLATNKFVQWSPGDEALFYDVHDDVWRQDRSGEGALLFGRRSGTQVGAFSLSGDGRQLSRASAGHRADCRGVNARSVVHDLETGDIVFEKKYRRGYVSPALWSPSGDRYLLVHSRSTRFFEDVEVTVGVHARDGQELRRLAHRFEAKDVLQWRWSPDGRAALSFSNDRAIRWESSVWQPSAVHEWLSEGSMEIEAIEWSPDSKWLARVEASFGSASSPGPNSWRWTLKLVRGLSLGEQQQVDLGPLRVQSLAWHPSGRYLVLSREPPRDPERQDRHLLLDVYDTRTWQRVAVRKVARTSHRLPMAWSHDGSRLAVGGDLVDGDEPYAPLLIPVEESLPRDALRESEGQTAGQTP